MLPFFDRSCCHRGAFMNIVHQQEYVPKESFIRWYTDESLYIAFISESSKWRGFVYKKNYPVDTKTLFPSKLKTSPGKVSSTGGKTQSCTSVVIKMMPLRCIQCSQFHQQEYVTKQSFIWWLHRSKLVTLLQCWYVYPPKDGFLFTVELDGWKRTSLE